MRESVTEDLYNRLIDINKQAFDAGLYDAAYHALMSALHCAAELKSNEPLIKVRTIATEQIKWIDENEPDYEHSTSSALKHHLPESIFTRMAIQADTIVKMRELKHRYF